MYCVKYIFLVVIQMLGCLSVWLVARLKLRMSTVDFGEPWGRECKSVTFRRQRCLINRKKAAVTLSSWRCHVLGCGLGAGGRWDPYVCDCRREAGGWEGDPICLFCPLDVSESRLKDWAIGGAVAQEWLELFGHPHESLMRKSNKKRFLLS